jgi:hypothetical protein
MQDWELRWGVPGYVCGTTIQETNMPVLLVPLLVGIPVVLGGGYLIYHVVR